MDCFFFRSFRYEAAGARSRFISKADCMFHSVRSIVVLPHDGALGVSSFDDRHRIWTGRSGQCLFADGDSMGRDRKQRTVTYLGTINGDTIAGKMFTARADVIFAAQRQASQ